MHKYISIFFFCSALPSSLAFAQDINMPQINLQSGSINSENNPKKKLQTDHQNLVRYFDSAQSEYSKIRLENPININLSEDVISALSEKKADIEYTAQKIRCLVMQYWKQFPNDYNKYQMLADATVITCYPQFWQNISSASRAYILANDLTGSKAYTAAINWNAYNEWQNFIDSAAVEFTNHENKKRLSVSKDNLLSTRIQVWNLYAFADLSQNLAFRKNGKMDLRKFELLLMAAGVYAKKDIFSTLTSIQSKEYLHSIFKNMGMAFISRYSILGLTETDVLSLINNFDLTEYPGFTKPLTQWKNILDLSKYPMKLSGPTLKGDTISLESYRGKVLLVDFWSLSCSACIGRMPYFQKMYEKYKSQGFEVLSVCVNENNDETKAKIRKIEDRVNATWPTIISGSTSNQRSISYDIWQRYGFLGVPQVFLLDRNGKMIAYNENHVNLYYGDIEQFLQTELIRN